MPVNGMTHILPEKEGAPVNVFNVLEYNQFKCHGEQQENELFIVYRNSEGEKKVHSIKDPPMEIYFVKPEFRKDFLTPREYYPIDQTYPAKVPARTVLRRIYSEMKAQPDMVGSQLINVYNNAQMTGQFRARKEILKWPYALMGDMDTESYYWVHTCTTR